MKKKEAKKFVKRIEKLLADMPDERPRGRKSSYPITLQHWQMLQQHKLNTERKSVGDIIGDALDVYFHVVGIPEEKPSEILQPGPERRPCNEQ